MPTSFTALSLRRYGFVGFETVADLRDDHYRAVPQGAGGIYVAVCAQTAMPLFKQRSRRVEWTLPVRDLRARWVPASTIVYIGKADATEAGNSLRTRVSRYLRASSSHSGGKRTWQLADWDELTIAWKVLPAREVPRAAERHLLAEHVARFGRLSFANG